MYMKLKVIGRVQGVFYRVSCREKAQQLGLTGWVRNAADGSVELEAAGARDSLEILIDWCRGGPSGARVDDVLVEWFEGEAEFDQENNFVIR